MSIFVYVRLPSLYYIYKWDESDFVEYYIILSLFQILKTKAWDGNWLRAFAGCSLRTWNSAMLLWTIGTTTKNLNTYVSENHYLDIALSRCKESWIFSVQMHKALLYITFHSRNSIVSKEINNDFLVYSN